MADWAIRIIQGKDDFKQINKVMACKEPLSGQRLEPRDKKALKKKDLNAHKNCP
jgi:hypothetical protein